MNDKHKTKHQLIKELARLRRQITKPGKPVAGKEQKNRDLNRSFLNPDDISDSLIIIDDKKRVTAVNRGFSRLWGYSSKEVTGKSFLKLFPRRERKKHLLEMTTAVSAKKPFYFETVSLTKKGVEIPVSVTGSAIFGKQGKLERFIALFRDITLQKNTEKNLIESKNFLKSIFESIPDGISILNGKMEIKGVNTAMEKWYSHSMPLVGKKCYQAYHGRTKSCDICPSRQTLRTGKPAYEVVPKTGKQKKLLGWQDLYSFPWYDSKTGKLNGVIEYVRDITERKKMEEALQASEEKFKALSEQSITGIYLIQDGKFAYVNPRLAEILGFQQEEMIGLSVLDLVAETDREIVRENFRKRLSGEVPSIHYTFRALNKNGSEVEMEVHGSSMMYQGRLAIIGTLLDITERKRAENDLKEAKEKIEQWSRELEERVNKKTAELEKSREQLIMSEKLAAMGRLSAGLAHELNSPLAGLLPLIEKYKNREKEGTNEFREMTLMLKACEHMAMIVRDFSAFSRRSAVERTRLNINDVIESTLSFTVDSLEKKEIKIIRQYGEPLPDILGNKTELQQVLINLLANARDAMPNGGQIIIKTSLSGDKKNVVMEFIDTGTGIESENLSKILDPFFTTKGIAEGTGLGLTVSYGIIKNHEGHISIESKPGKGARFIISLPAIKYHERKDTNN